MKRFGLMRLVDCTYDWHFNLIDPERLPSDMSKLNTPNFEYTRYQPLKRLNLKMSSDSSGTITVSANPSGILVVGDQIFNDKGYYLGKVDAITDNGSSSTLDLVGSTVRKPVIKSDGTQSYYYGYIYVCGDGVTAITSQDFSDSFYRFKLKVEEVKILLFLLIFLSRLICSSKCGMEWRTFNQQLGLEIKEIFNDSDYLEFLSDTLWCNR